MSELKDLLTLGKQEMLLEQQGKSTTFFTEGIGRINRISSFFQIGIGQGFEFAFREGDVKSISHHDKNYEGYSMYFEIKFKDDSSMKIFHNSHI
jgi:hypothetical protein